jgi:catechol 2,3-dioxygenase-like lactoylglutathione lyase family enzyme
MFEVSMSRTTRISALALGAFLITHPLSADRASQRPHIFGIARVNIFSTDVPRARPFYMKVLGIREGACDWCERIPGSTFFVNPHQAIELLPAPSPAPSNLISDIWFATDNVHELRRYLMEQGIQVSGGAEGDRAADVFLSVVDPEGHHIRFVRDPGVPIAPVADKPVSGPARDLHIIHAGFIVHDRAATEHFYKDILGFRPYWHGGMKDDQTDWVSLQVPDGTDWLEFMVNVPLNADQRLRGIMDHIAIGVTDIHATEERVRADGLKFTEQPKIGRDGKWQLNLYDPDETRVEFMEFKPVQEPCCSEFTGPHPGPKQ